jgi:hypothetical protein
VETEAPLALYNSYLIFHYRGRGRVKQAERAGLLREDDDNASRRTANPYRRLAGSSLNLPFKERGDVAGFIIGDKR